MSARNRRFGKGREMKRVEWHIAQGREAALRPRIDGNEAGYDVLVCDSGVITLEQVKGVKQHPISAHEPAQRELHKQAALRAGGSPVLVWLPPYARDWAEIPEDAWPR
jgi:hypothetical protein